MTSVFESVLCRVMVLLWFWHSYLRVFFFFVSLKQAALAFRHHWPDIHASTSISSLEAMEARFLHRSAATVGAGRVVHCVWPRWAPPAIVTRPSCLIIVAKLWLWGNASHLLAPENVILRAIISCRLDMTVKWLDVPPHSSRSVIQHYSYQMDDR